jgi:hypothetical protein
MSVIFNNFSYAAIESMIISVMTNLLSALIIFFISYLTFLRAKVKISNKIFQHNKDEIDYIIKLVNKSMFLKARNFDIKLYAVKKSEVNGSFLFDINANPIPIGCSTLSELSTLKPRLLFKILEKIEIGKSYACWFGIQIKTDIFNDYKDYDLFLLELNYKDQLGNEFTVKKCYKNDKNKTVRIGDFSFDGRLDYVYPLSKNGEKKRQKRSENGDCHPGPAHINFLLLTNPAKLHNS